MSDQIEEKNDDSLKENLADDFARLSYEAEQEEGSEDWQQSENEEPPTPPTKDIIFAALKPVTAIICPNWDIKDNELYQLSDVYGDLLDKYFPDSFNNFGLEITAIMTTAMVVMPRIGTPRVKKEIKKEAVKDENE